MDRSAFRLAGRGGALLVVFALVASACASDSDDDVLVGLGSGGEDPFAGQQPRTPATPEDTAVGALEDVQTFWRETYPTLYGSEFPELAGGTHPYSSAVLPPPCGPYEISYEEIAENAFYCPPPTPTDPGDWDGDYVAWDEEGLLPWIAEEFSMFTIGIVLAHEFGHAVQYRTDELDGPSVGVEMQADCFAGAWTAWVADGNAQHFGLDAEMLDQSLAGMIAIRDLPGTRPDDPWAHGSGFDRVNAFQEGFEQGASRCSQYASDPPVVTEVEFTTAEEEASGGNLPIEETYPLMTDALETFYTEIFSTYAGQEWEPLGDLVVVDPGVDQITCDGQTYSQDQLQWAFDYCAEENVAVVDGVNLVPDLYSMGDFAVGAELGRLWATAAQDQLDVAPSKDASLQADCLNGVFAAALWDDSAGDFGIRLSAGDLDEAIMAVLRFDDTEGTAFERAAALRTGFLRGVNGCDEEYLPLA